MRTTLLGAAATAALLLTGLPAAAQQQAEPPTTTTERPGQSAVPPITEQAQQGRSTTTQQDGATVTIVEPPAQGSGAATPGAAVPSGQLAPGGEGYPSARPLAGHMMADDIVGSNVTGADDQRVGTVDDLILDAESGRIEAAVLSVGGFLGIGDKLVAVPMSQLEIGPEREFRISMTREELEQAPEFDPDAAETAEGGAEPPAGAQPAPAGAPPTTTTTD
jgi:sporulation protein YlmC with PRC-barrel domain